MITLKTLAEATEQQVFDQVAVHLLTQNKKSTSYAKSNDVEKGLECAYRGNGGLTCAAGCLIADDEYNPKMDSMPATSWSALIQAGLVKTDAHRDLIADLQVMHDVGPVSEWKEQLLAHAGAYGLDTKAISDITVPTAQNI